MTSPRIRLTLAAAALCAAAPAAAQAAKGPVANPYNAQALCGPGYAEIGRKPMYDTLLTNGRTVKVAEGVLFYNASNGVNCAVVMKSFRLNKKTHTYVTLATRPRSAANTRSDNGNFQYYAGPVRLYARGKCIWWQGGMDYSLWAGQWWTPRRAGFRTGWVHCR